MTFEDEISGAIEYLEHANGNCDTDCEDCKYNNDCWSYKSRKMAIRSLGAWDKVKADITETILYYKDWGQVEIKAQHKEEALKEVLDCINRHLKGVMEDVI